MLARAAESDATVLLEGETGTGKSQAAQAVHGRSARRDGPFVIVDRGAILGNLLESERFGHEKGAFTGAAERRIGAFEEAAGGTLFLDEIGELPLDPQPKLLRALEVRRSATSARTGVDDPRLWTATTYCMRIRDRISLLGVYGEEEARAPHETCLRRVKQARAAGPPELHRLELAERARVPPYVSCPRDGLSARWSSTDACTLGFRDELGRLSAW